MCNCTDCTDDVLDLEPAEGGTCFERMKDRWTQLDVTEDRACQIVSEDFPRQCGPKCNPAKCDNRAPAYCSCNECTDFVLNLLAGDFSCFDRIKALRDNGVDEEEACRQVSIDYPEICGPKCHPG